MGSLSPGWWWWGTLGEEGVRGGASGARGGWPEIGQQLLTKNKPLSDEENCWPFLRKMAPLFRGVCVRARLFTCVNKRTRDVVENLQELSVETRLSSRFRRSAAPNVSTKVSFVSLGSFCRLWSCEDVFWQKENLNVFFDLPPWCLFFIYYYFLDPSAGETPPASGAFTPDHSLTLILDFVLSSAVSHTITVVLLQTDVSLSNDAQRAWAGRGGGSLFLLSQ